MKRQLLLQLLILSLTGRAADGIKHDSSQMETAEVNNLKSLSRSSIIQAKLVADDGAVDTRLGDSVSLWRNRALISAYHSTVSTLDSSVYIFENDGNSWTQTQKLMASAEGFGNSVSLVADRALIGASSDDDNLINAGSAYIFDYNGNNWNQTTKLTADDADSSDFFGFAVSLAGNRALIGASFDDDNGSGSGSAYIFEYDGVAWTQTQKITPSDGNSSDSFGTSVSLWGDLAIIGASNDDDNGSNSGSVYVFEYDGLQWLEVAKLLATDGDVSDHFGSSVSLWDNRALIGAYSDDDNGGSSGSAYIFQFNGSNWLERSKLVPIDGIANGFFGIEVSLGKDKALIGAAQDDDNGNGSGSAYVYQFDGLDWTQTQKLTAPDGTVDDFFGSSVSLYEKSILIGSPLDDDAGDRSGSAYLFQENIIFINSFE